MANRDHYMTVAQEISKYMNAFGLAFKTYNISEFDNMIKAVANDGARVTGEDTSRQLQNALLERGFTVFPSIMDADAEDGYVRVIRTNSIVSNLLNAFRYVGPSGDTELAKLLTQIKRRSNSDVVGPEITE